MALSKTTLGAALLASLAINILILGAIGGYVVAGLRHPPAAHQMTRTPPMQQQFSFDPRRFVRALPKTERQKAIRVLKRAAPEHRRIFQNIHKTNKEIAVLLMADELDDVKIQAAFNHLRDLEIEAKNLGQNLVLKVVQDLDPQTRRRIIRAASRRQPPGDRKKRHQKRTRPERKD
jgi:uncharacterized membrane protein